MYCCWLAVCIFVGCPSVFVVVWPFVIVVCCPCLLLFVGCFYCNFLAIYNFFVWLCKTFIGWPCVLLLVGVCNCCWLTVCIVLSWPCVFLVCLVYCFCLTVCNCCWLVEFTVAVWPFVLLIVDGVHCRLTLCMVFGCPCVLLLSCCLYIFSGRFYFYLALCIYILPCVLFLVARV